MIPLRKSYLEQVISLKDPLENLLRILESWQPYADYPIKWALFTKEQRKVVLDLIHFIVSERYWHKNKKVISEKLAKEQKRDLKKKYQKKLVNSLRGRRIKVNSAKSADDQSSVSEQIIW